MKGTECQACGKSLGVIERQRWDVCLPCTVARQRTVTQYHGRCHCSKRKRRPVECSTHTTYGRRWIACKRCLGTIEQLS